MKMAVDAFESVQSKRKILLISEMPTVWERPQYDIITIFL